MEDLNALPHFRCGILVYLATGLVGALFVRVILKFLAACQVTYESPLKSWLSLICQRWMKLFKGFICDYNIDPDYWHPYAVGFLELWVYPILMFHNFWTAVGAWIGLKFAVQWSRWNENRPAFNRFVIGSALLVILAYLIRHYMLC